MRLLILFVYGVGLVLADDAASDGKFLFDDRCAVVDNETSSGGLCPQFARCMDLRLASSSTVDMHIGGEQILCFEFACTRDSDMGGMAESFELELASAFGLYGERLDIELEIGFGRSVEVEIEAWLGEREFVRSIDLARTIDVDSAQIRRRNGEASYEIFDRHIGRHIDVKDAVAHLGTDLIFAHERT